MRQVLDTTRKKQVFNLSFAEFKKGDWLKLIPDSELVEVTYKKFYLTIHDASIRKVHREIAETANNEVKQENGRTTERNKHKGSKV